MEVILLKISKDWRGSQAGEFSELRGIVSIGKTLFRGSVDLLGLERATSFHTLQERVQLGTVNCHGEFNYERVARVQEVAPGVSAWARGLSQDGAMELCGPIVDIEENSGVAVVDAGDFLLPVPELLAEMLPRDDKWVQLELVRCRLVLYGLPIIECGC